MPPSPHKLDTNKQLPPRTPCLLGLRPALCQAHSFAAPKVQLPCSSTLLCSPLQAAPGETWLWGASSPLTQLRQGPRPVLRPSQRVGPARTLLAAAWHNALPHGPSLGSLASLRRVAGRRAFPQGTPFCPRPACLPPTPPTASSAWTGSIARGRLLKGPEPQLQARASYPRPPLSVPLCFQACRGRSGKTKPVCSRASSSTREHCRPQRPGRAASLPSVASCVLHRPSPSCPPLFCRCVWVCWSHTSLRVLYRALAGPGPPLLWADPGVASLLCAPVRLCCWPSRVRQAACKVH